MMTLFALQTEVYEWSHRNFPNNKPHHPLLGMVEEFEELNCAESREDKIDAVADIIIYAADYCGRNEIMLESPGFGPAVGDVGKLCHFHLKGEQGIRYDAGQIRTGKQQCIHQILSGLSDYCALELNMKLEECYDPVWKKVQQRDWQKNPISAAKIVEG